MRLEDMSVEELDLERFHCEADEMYLNLNNRHNTQEARDVKSRIKQIDAELAWREGEKNAIK